jgi:hypothetical protein
MITIEDILIFAPYVAVPLLVTAISFYPKTRIDAFSIFITGIAIFFYPFILFHIIDANIKLTNNNDGWNRLFKLTIILINTLVLLPITIILQILFDKIFLPKSKNGF